MSIRTHCQLDCLQYMLPGRVPQSQFGWIASQYEWFILRNVRRGVLETGFSRNSTGKQCHLAVFVNGATGNACCPLVFSSRHLDGLLVSFIAITYEMFSKRFGANDGGLHQIFHEILCNTVSNSTHCQLDCLQYMLPGRVPQSQFGWIASQYD